jgi:hypothetical protein
VCRSFPRARVFVIKPRPDEILRAASNGRAETPPTFENRTRERRERERKRARERERESKRQQASKKERERGARTPAWIRVQGPIDYPIPDYSRNPFLQGYLDDKKQRPLGPYSGRQATL